MANTFEVQTLVDGPRNLVIKLHLDGDGSGDESARTLVDVSQHNCSEVRIMHIQASFVSFTAELIWDAASNVHCFQIPDYDVDQDFRRYGGLVNNAGAGKTGDVLITTSGLGNNETGHLVLSMRKRGAPLVA